MSIILANSTKKSETGAEMLYFAIYNADDKIKFKPAEGGAGYVANGMKVKWSKHAMDNYTSFTIHWYKAGPTKICEGSVDDGGAQEIFCKNGEFYTRSISDSSGIVADIETDPHAILQDEGHDGNGATNPDGSPTDHETPDTDTVSDHDMPPDEYNQDDTPWESGPSL